MLDIRPSEQHFGTRLLVVPPTFAPLVQPPPLATAMRPMSVIAEPVEEIEHHFTPGE